jgi:hypothetical protein
MAGLFDIAPRSKTISVRGAQITVKGLSSKHLTAIADEYPPLKEALEKNSVEVPVLVRAFLWASGPIIAAAYGHFGNKETEEFASSLCLADQIQIMIPIIELTLPGIAPPLALALSKISCESSEEGNSEDAQNPESKVSLMQ